jgi:peptidoglycan/xylan/chitin deacetylase (PgdA/CDA1 family)
MKKIRILLYNQVGQYPLEAMEDGLLPENLVEQLDYLIANGYKIIGLDETLAHMKGEINLPENSLAITFDGGYADAYTHVLPKLEKYGVKAAFFIAPALIGGNRVIRGHALPCMDWEQVKAIAERGMDIGHYGCNGRIFTQVPKEAIEEDIRVSKPIFDKYLGTQPICYAVNEGTPEPAAIQVLKENGYTALFTKSPTNQGPNHYAIGRIQVDDEDLNIFLTKMSGSYLMFKDSPYWKYIRKFRLAKVFHHLSEFYNHIKGRLDSSKTS